MFTIFLIIAAWNLPLPQWLQVCLTVFGSLHVLFGYGEIVIRIHKNN